MTDHSKGWMYFLAAMGMMLTLEAVEIANLQAWESATSPAFVAKLLAHLGTVIGAFIGGKLIPSKGE